MYTKRCIKNMYRNQCTQNNVYKTIYTKQSTQNKTMYTRQCIKNNVYKTYLQINVYITMYRKRSIQNNVYQTMYTKQCRLNNV